MGMDAQLSAILGDMETWQRPPPSRGKDSDARRDGDDYKHRPSFSGNSLEFLPPSSGRPSLARASTRAAASGLRQRAARVRAVVRAVAGRVARRWSPNRASLRSPNRASARTPGGALPGPAAAANPAPARRSTRRQSAKQVGAEKQLARAYSVAVDLPTPSPLGRPSRVRKSMLKPSPYASSPDPKSPVFGGGRGGATTTTTRASSPSSGRR
ncbi:hypothetical protein SO694_00095090 [Aureococcus anophagefferens]|uniref:Uncharacterized protein n=1 Tax=Aureococcus anophagefferens TaxID=44056 RepID=A0ABR1FSQ9_AURAN